MRAKPAYATPIVHFYDGSHFTRDDEPKTPCSKIYGESPIDNANDRFRLTDNLEEVSCPVCFRVVEEGREEPAPRSRQVVVVVPRKKPSLRRVRERAVLMGRRAALQERTARMRKVMTGALALVALRRGR